MEKHPSLRAIDGDVGLALKRLHNRRMLEEVNAPEQVVRRAQELLERSMSEIGHEFSEIENAYPDYKIRVEEEYRRENEWQARCTGCQFWTSLVDEDQENWCEKIAFDDRSYPDPCTEYIEEVDGDIE